MAHVDQFVPVVDSPHKARNYLVNALNRDLVGPGWIKGSMDPDPNEVLILDLRSQPSRYYLTGMLMPSIREEIEEADVAEASTHIDPLREDELPPESQQMGASGAEENVEENRVRSGDGLLTPRSVGLTVQPRLVDGDWNALVKCTWGTYHRNENEEADSDNKVRWYRTQHAFEHTLRASDFVDEEPIQLEIENAFPVRVHVRYEQEMAPTLTVRLVNDAIHDRSDWAGICDSTMFQVGISLELSGGINDVRKTRTDRIEDMDLLYSDSYVLASGHNIGVDWNTEQTLAWTTSIPAYEVPLMRGDETLQALIPQLDYLCDENGIVGALERVEDFVKTYERWQHEQSEHYSSRIDLSHFQEIFQGHNANVSSTIDRIRAGAKFLLENPTERRAFMLANRAIRTSQRADSLHADYRNENFEWRPFQFAFQLLNVEGLLGGTDHEHRELLDLAWFPTGGGKTEAYLGLIAMIAFYRRLDPERGPREMNTPGISAIMRYTLRLLTADQASRLIRLCGAMNIVWSEQAEDGQHFAPFTTGMWIGESSSPNKFYTDERYQNQNKVSVQDIFDHHNRGEELPESTFIQFNTCPWCKDESLGSVDRWRIQRVQSTVTGYEVPKLVGTCASSSCPFHSGIPFSCVDEDLYLHPPTILLGTVDKMVQLAHNHSAKSIQHGGYERVDQLNSRRMFGFSPSGPLPPDLIIQDELHLLSGPLGTLAGMIETALTSAWEHVGHKPKYVAATATIRGASRDIGLIYGRQLRVFPPPLLSAKDNFFAKEQPVSEETPGRIHLGLLAPPRRARSATDQPSASLLQSIQSLKEAGAPDDILDPYWTLVMYFNSLRELGGGQSSLRENIPRWMEQYASSSGQALRNLADGGEVELTSRKSSTELTLSRQRLNTTLQEDPGYVVDVLSTSNMFQVGVDIPRLGLMAIVGQPRSNSEYIQSSGRVGRKLDKPGLVVSILRGTYPRDQSHYEQFRSFHQEFYRHVDFTSVTPFTHRALDRGFATALMLLLRMGSVALAPQEGPSELGGNRVLDGAEELVRRFTNAVQDRQNELEDANTELTQVAINIIHGEWDRLKRLVQVSEGPVWWIIWNEQQVARMTPKPVSWMKSPFRLTNPFEPGDLVEQLPSLRDVASEVQLKHVHPQRFEFMTMPEGHLMAHMAPGNIWEKGGVPYLTMGISRWDNTLRTGFDERTSGSEAMNSPNHPRHSGLLVEEPTLTAVFGHGRALRLLPKSGTNPNTLSEHGAVTYEKYPWTFVCDEHGHISTGQRWNHELGHHVCKKASCNSPSRPSRFISLCTDGHMSPFDYHYWVHSGSDGCRDRSQLRLKLGPDAALTLSNWVIHCDACGKSRNMLGVPWVKSSDTHDAPKCNGRRDWLAGNNAAKEECDHRMVHRQVGNTSVTMNEGGSIMIIPPYTGWDFVDAEMVRRLQDSNNYEDFKQQWLSDLDHFSLRRYLNDLAGTSYDTGHGDIDHESITQRLWAYHQQNSGDEILTLLNLRRRERMGLVSEDSGQYSENQFAASVVAGGFEVLPDGWRNPQWPLSSANQVHRLTELRYIDGLRRLETDGGRQPLDLPEHRPAPPEEQFGIGMYNHGEGLYFDIKPEWLQKQVDKRSKLSPAHRNMDLAFERLMPSMIQQLPSLQERENRSGFTVLHTFSHCLIKALAQTSGFSLGSIRERLYYHCENGVIIDAGILLYTSAPSSDGTLGGLVQQGATVERVEALMNEALHSLSNCSNDPICSEHLPTAEETNGAACHTCVLLPETSCEFANHMLDRNWG